MMAVKQFQHYRISFELTNSSGFVGTMTLLSSSTFSVNSGFDPKLRSIGVTSAGNSQSHAMEH